MTKLCSVCGTENREEAQFCRSCGTAFPPPAPASEDESQLGAGITCDECNFQNKPGVRYCANCGVSLLGTVIVPRGRAATPPDPYAGTSPPPISYPSYAPVAPYPPPPLENSSYPPVAGTSYAVPPAYPPAYNDPLGPTEISDSAAALAAARQHRAHDDAPASAPAATLPAFAAPAPNRAPLIMGVVVALLVAGGAAAWWFMRGSGTPAPGAAASAVPMAAPAPAVVEPAASAVAAPAASAAEVAAAPPPEPAASPVEAATTAPVAAPVVEPAGPSASDVEAQRIAAEKKRERDAKAKADREAKAAKALAEQQQQQAAAQRAAEQEAARHRAEEAARARPAPPPPVAPAPVQARGVQQICAGRGMIAESMCQSLECGKTEHANEPLCKQIKEKEDRRRGG
jgi:Double zinc ribbon